MGSAIQSTANHPDQLYLVNNRTEILLFEIFSLIYNKIYELIL